MSIGLPVTDPFEPLNLPSAIHAQANKLLEAIVNARTPAETLRAADRAEGFTLGVETVRALKPDTLEALYLAFEVAFQARQAGRGG